MKLRCWLVALSVILFFIIGVKLRTIYLNHQFQVLSETVSQQINQQPVKQSSEYHIYEPPFDFDPDNFPQFRIFSKAPELRIQLYKERSRSTASKIFNVSLATLILGIPFLVLSFMSIGACLSFIVSFFAILFGNLSSQIEAFVSSLPLALVTGVFAVLCFSIITEPLGPPRFREIQASHESLTDVSNSGTEVIPGSTIQYFDLFRCPGDAHGSDSYELYVVTNQKLDEGKYRRAPCGFKYANYQDNKGINLYSSESTNRIVWLGLALADFYDTEFHVSEKWNSN